MRGTLIAKLKGNCSSRDLTWINRVHFDAMEQLFAGDGEMEKAE